MPSLLPNHRSMPLLLLFRLFPVGIQGTWEDSSSVVSRVSDVIPVSESLPKSLLMPFQARLTIYPFS
jgi:hypothetical protein